VVIVKRRHAPAGEIDDLDIQLQGNAISQLTRISEAAGTGKQSYGA
jgi:hypothetical protein